MAVPAVLSFRSATEDDRSRLANLLHFETHVHRHLDWRRPLDWLGSQPFLVSDSGGRMQAALACPQDPPGVAWLRLFAVVTRLSTEEAWELLWPAARLQLGELGAKEAAAIPLYDWFRRLLAGSGFGHTHNVVVLDWRVAPVETESQAMRPMRWEDLPAVHAVDAAAFAPLWQNSLAALEQAYKQAGLATVVEDGGEIVAYQLSTLTTQGLHLARLATHPNMQGRGLALRLVRDLQANVVRRGDQRLSVNTQDNNTPSLSLYKKLGFELTQELFPVYQLDLS
jgi:ribosomal protein S18 acetylase RimI-like enzyme